MPKFRKKPVVIEAFEFNNRWDNIPPDWLIWARVLGVVRVAVDHLGCATGMTIQTLEGPMTASLGDWIIQGVKGEIYACKPDIFAATYEPADE